MQLRNFTAALQEHRDLLVDQIEFVERGNQVIASGEEPEASRAKFLATLQKHKADVEDFNAHCEAMRVVPAESTAPSMIGD